MSKPVLAAVRLRLSNDREPGWRREGEPGAFRYRDAGGRLLRAKAALERIRQLVIPPAWTQVWICADANGHLQATGRDARGRKQYRYHPAWQASRADDKFQRLRDFAQALPRLRRAVQRQLAPLRRGLAPVRPERERLLATLVQLLDRTWMRIGNAAYARENRSYGLSTLQRRHARVQGSQLQIRFTGKSGVPHQVALDDPAVARIVQRCRELPGQQLFQYETADGQLQRIDSADVNAWLSETAGLPITAKDFRTWHGSVYALDRLLAACSAAEPPSPAQVLQQVAQRLGNTPAVCRKAYVHPQVLALCEQLPEPEARAALRAAPWLQARCSSARLSASEQRLCRLLDHASGRRPPTRRKESHEARPAKAQQQRRPRPAGAAAAARARPVA